MVKSNKYTELEQRVGELTLDLQRTRADFENYRKRVESEKSMARASGRVSAVLQLLPIVDTIERAMQHAPKELKNNPWVSGITNLSKMLDKMLADMGVKRIEAKAGTLFNPELHEAVQFDEADGEREVIAEELQTGYLLGDEVLRPGMVRVTKQ